MELALPSWGFPPWAVAWQGNMSHLWPSQSNRLSMSPAECCAFLPCAFLLLGTEYTKWHRTLSLEWNWPNCWLWKTATLVTKNTELNNGPLLLARHLGDVCKWHVACCGCQLVNPPATANTPLCPIPLTEVPFERIGMDLSGPSEQPALILIFVSSGGLFNVISGSHASEHDFCMQHGSSTFSKLGYSKRSWLIKAQILCHGHWASWFNY